MSDGRGPGATSSENMMASAVNDHTTRASDTSVVKPETSSIFARNDTKKGKTKEIDLMLEEMKRAHDNNNNTSGDPAGTTRSSVATAKLMGHDRASELRRYLTGAVIACSHLLD